MLPNDDIIEELLSDVAFFADATDHTKIYAQYKKDDEILRFNRCDSEEFKACLRIWHKRVIGSNKPLDVKALLTYISDQRLFYSDFPLVEARTRTAGSLKTGIEYFLADDKASVIEIKNGRWALAEQPQHHFLTPAIQKTQVMPKKTDQNLTDLLAPIVNLKGDDLTLFAIWLTQAFSGGAHYGVMLSAERGSSKSTLTRLIKDILDPSKIRPMQLQTKLADFQDVLADNYLCCYDNLRKIPEDFSDTIAAAITGSTVAKRVLYTTSTVTYMQLCNTIVLNGIGLFPTESDLAERFLFFEMKKLTSDQLKPDADIDQLFAENRPYILGAIFELLAKASLIIQKPISAKPTRMTTSYNEMLCIAKAMGISEEKFDKIIRENIRRLQKACAATPLVQAVVEYMNGPGFGKRKIQLPSTDFYVKVRDNYSGKRSDLPSSAAAFSKRLKAEHDALLTAGYGSLIDDTGPASSVITIIREKN